MFLIFFFKKISILFKLIFSYTGFQSNYALFRASSLYYFNILIVLIFFISIF